jgi:Family of unknown function (DUF6521)
MVNRRANDAAAMANPALSGLILSEFVRSYAERGRGGPSLPVTFVVLPISMARPGIRSFQGTNRKTGFLTWLSRNPQLAVTLPDTIARARHLTRQALCFSLAYQLFKLTTNSQLVPVKKLRALKGNAIEDERISMVRTAQMLGLWMAEIPDETIFYSLGVTV